MAARMPVTMSTTMILIRTFTNPTICGTFAMLASTFGCFGQPVNGGAQLNLVEPEFAEVFYWLDGATLRPLERLTGTIRAKANGFIVMNVKTRMAFPGSTSSVRVPNGRALDIVVRSGLAAAKVDPSATYWLREVVSTGRTRELVLNAGHASPLGATFNATVMDGVVPVRFALYGKSSYKMSTPPLPPGEYVVSRAFSRDAFFFGIDDGPSPTGRNVTKSTADLPSVSVTPQRSEPSRSPTVDFPNTGTLRFASDPLGAEVLLDGEFLGSTPMTEIKVSPGHHTITVKKRGYRNWERKITLAPGDTRAVNAELESEPKDPTKPRIVGLDPSN